MRTDVKSVNRYGRQARGVIVMRLNEGDEVAGIAVFRADAPEEVETGPQEPMTTRRQLGADRATPMPDNGDRPQWHFVHCCASATGPRRPRVPAASLRGGRAFVTAFGSRAATRLQRPVRPVYGQRQS